MPDTIQIANPAAGTYLADSSVQSVVNALRPLTSIVPAAGSATAASPVQGSAVPTTSQRGQIWYRMSADGPTGILLGTYFYFNGLWCKQYGVMPGALMAWDGGDPTPYFNPTTGKGLLVGTNSQIANDWYGWQLVLAGNADGLAGSTASPVTFSLFPVAASRWNSGTGEFEALLQDPTGAQVNGLYQSTGGSAVQQTLTPAMIPSLGGTVTLAGSQMVDDPDDAASTGSPTLIIDNRPKPGGAATSAQSIGYPNPNTNQTATPIPFQYMPFKAIPFLKFIGYNYTDPTVA